MCSAEQIKQPNGYTLLEAVIALAVWSVLALTAAGLLVYVSRSSARMLNEAEAFENARAAVDALTANLQMADTVRVENDYDGILRKLTLTERDPDGRSADYIFYFNASALPIQAKYHRLEFGLNDEFASRIARVTLSLSGEVMTVTVVTDDTLCAPFTFQSMVDVRYKQVTVIP